MHTSSAKDSLGTPRHIAVLPFSMQLSPLYRPPCRFQLLQLPQTLICFLSSAGLLCLAQTPAYYAAVRKLSPGREIIGLTLGVFLHLGLNIVLSGDQYLNTIAWYILSSSVAVYYRRTSMLPVKTRIGSLPLKHAFLTCVHFWKKKGRPGGIVVEFALHFGGLEFMGSDPGGRPTHHLSSHAVVVSHIQNRGRLAEMLAQGQEAKRGGQVTDVSPTGQSSSPKRKRDQFRSSKLGWFILMSWIY